jgi:polyhydroxyalkanoate synthesis repressor PhaR
MSEPQTPQRLSIKKYPNRRYYDSTRSRHVTFEELYALVREGYEIHVTDSKTDEDITAKVLTQLIVEFDSLKLGVFPVPLLHGVLRSTPQAVGEYVRRYFTQMLGVYLDTQNQLQQYMQRMMEMRSEDPTMADWERNMWDQDIPASTHQHPPEAPADEDGNKSPASEQQLKQELEALRRQMQSLQQRMGKGRRKASRQKR